MMTYKKRVKQWKKMLLKRRKKNKEKKSNKETHIVLRNKLMKYDSLRELVLLLFFSPLLYTIPSKVGFP